MGDNVENAALNNSKPFGLNTFLNFLKKPKTLFNKAKLFLFDADQKKKSFKDELQSYKNALKTLALFPEKNSNLLPVLSIEECGLAVSEADSDAIRLKDLFLKFGSDKSTQHNYYLLYAGILKNKHGSFNIFEMGLGTNHLEMISNMGPEGRPGASLRAFKQMYPSATIYGADIDRRILFKEERIQTFYANQLDKDSLSELHTQISPVLFDLVIDDGLHTPEANINTFEFAMKILAPNGAFVIEDIKETDVVFFHLMANVLEPDFNIQIISTKAAYVCVIKKIE